MPVRCLGRPGSVRAGGALRPWTYILHPRISSSGRPRDGGWRESRVILPRILVVDDDRAAREILVESLESAGYRCAAASNGAEALVKACQGGIDLVLSDIEMPGQTGAE